MRIIVTGGSGFIGSELIRYILKKEGNFVLNIDNLSYAGNELNLKSVENNKNYLFKKIDITNFSSIYQEINDFKPNLIFHLAAESHVDRSIDSPARFIETNVIGTYNMLESSKYYYDRLDHSEKDKFRFLHVSTDEVYGDLTSDDLPFSEENAYKPRSPYSASKASSDHLVRAWYKTYKLPVLITNCSNNYGKYQYPEKLIPLVISKAINGNPIPVYGDGQQIRDWLHVSDHVRALYKVILKGKIGNTYNIGGNCEIKNIDIVQNICETLDSIFDKKPNDINSFKDLIEFVIDRSGHDRRYAINSQKVISEIGWSPKIDFKKGLRETIAWYLDNRDWVNAVTSDSYHFERLGLER